MTTFAERLSAHNAQLVAVAGTLSDAAALVGVLGCSLPTALGWRQRHHDAVGLAREGSAATCWETIHCQPGTRACSLWREWGVVET